MSLKDRFTQGPQAPSARRMTVEDRQELRGIGDAARWVGQRVAKLFGAEETPVAPRGRLGVGNSTRVTHSGFMPASAPVELTVGKVGVSLSYNASFGTPAPSDISAYVLAKYPGMSIVASREATRGLIHLILANVDAEAADNTTETDQNDRGPAVGELEEGTGKIAQALPLVPPPPPTTDADPMGGDGADPMPPDEDDANLGAPPDITLEEALQGLDDINKAIQEKVQSGGTILDGKEVEPVAAPPEQGAPMNKEPAAAAPITAAMKVTPEPQEIENVEKLKVTDPKKLTKKLTKKELDKAKRREKQLIREEEERHMTPAQILDRHLSENPARDYARDVDKEKKRINLEKRDPRFAPMDTDEPAFDMGLSDSLENEYAMLDELAREQKVERNNPSKAGLESKSELPLKRLLPIELYEKIMQPGAGNRGVDGVDTYAWDVLTPEGRELCWKAMAPASTKLKKKLDDGVTPAKRKELADLREEHKELQIQLDERRELREEALALAEQQEDPEAKDQITRRNQDPTPEELKITERINEIEKEISELGKKTAPKGRSHTIGLAPQDQKELDELERRKKNIELMYKELRSDSEHTDTTTPDRIAKSKSKRDSIARRIFDIDRQVGKTETKLNTAAKDELRAERATLSTQYKELSRQIARIPADFDTMNPEQQKAIIDSLPKSEAVELKAEWDKISEEIALVKKRTQKITGNTPHEIAQQHKEDSEKVPYGTVLTPSLDPGKTKRVYPPGTRMVPTMDEHGKTTYDWPKDVEPIEVESPSGLRMKYVTPEPQEIENVEKLKVTDPSTIPGTMVSATPESASPTGAPGVHKRTPVVDPVVDPVAEPVAEPVAPVTPHDLRKVKQPAAVQRMIERIKNRLHKHSVDESAKDYWEEYWRDYGHELVEGCCEEHDRQLNDRKSAMREIAGEFGRKVTDHEVNVVCGMLHQRYVPTGEFNLSAQLSTRPSVNQMVDMLMEKSNANPSWAKALDRITLRFLMTQSGLLNSISEGAQKNILMRAARAHNGIYKSLERLYNKVVDAGPSTTDAPVVTPGVTQEVEDNTMKTADKMKTPKPNKDHSDAIKMEDMEDVADKKQIPIRRGLKFSYEHPVLKGKYTFMDVTWEPKDVGDMGSEALRQQVVSYVKGLESRKECKDFGYLGKIHIESVDDSAGLAVVYFRTQSSPATLEVNQAKK